MEPQKTMLIDTAAGIIMHSGLSSLSFSRIAKEMNITESELFLHLRQVDDIVVLLLSDLELELSTFIGGLRSLHEEPETEVIILFKKLYFLFLQKPYYLDLIFDRQLRCRDNQVKDTIIRIRKMAVAYLSEIIDKGKEERVFKTKIPTKTLTTKMLSEFRMLMNDERRVRDMIREMKSLKD